MKQPMVSIIVPVYNTADFLPPCIDSVLAQRYPDFELLLIDDGSQDCSGAICDAYQQRDARIRVYHFPNRGSSAARNAGLELSTGDYIAFLDSDDYLQPLLLGKDGRCRREQP